VLLKEAFETLKDTLQRIRVVGTKEHQTHFRPCYRQFIRIPKDSFDKGLILRLGNKEKIGIFAWVSRVCYLTDNIP
jgi:hypothetical protein